MSLQIKPPFHRRPHGASQPDQLPPVSVSHPDILTHWAFLRFKGELLHNLLWRDLFLEGKGCAHCDCSMNVIITESNTATPWLSNKLTIYVVILELFKLC